MAASSGFLPLSLGSTWTAQPPPDLTGIQDIELDVESTGLDRFTDRPVGLAVGAAGRYWYLPFGHRGGGNLDEGVVKRWARTELRGKRIRNLNIPVDLHWLINWGVDLREQDCTFHDIAHAEALIDDHRRRFNLDQLARDYLAVGKLDAGPAAGIADQHAADVAEYAMRDVRLVAEIAARQAPRLAAEGLETVMALEDRVIPAVIEMERQGMPLDVEGLTAARDALRQLRTRLVLATYRETGLLINPDARLDLAKLWRACGEPIRHRTATGAPSFTTEVVEEAAVRHPAIRRVWQIGKLDDLLSKYYDKYLAEHRNGVLYPTLRQLAAEDEGTVSGRFSCVRPNLQQVVAANKFARVYGWLAEYDDPMRYFVKRYFRPLDGRRWVSADMAQCEFRLFVHYSNSARLLDYYRRDPSTNFHKMTYEIIVAQKPDVDHTQTKIFSFLNMYGGTDRAVMKQLRIDAVAAAELSATYHAAFPEMRELTTRATRVAETRGYVRTFLGRRARFSGAQQTHAALNRVIQGTGADANKLALAAVYEARRDLDYTLRMTIHDSMEGDQADDPRQLARLTELLNDQRLPLRVPLLWTVKSSRESWGAAA